jgi:hypothetical protein
VGSPAKCGGSAGNEVLHHRRHRFRASGTSAVSQISLLLPPPNWPAFGLVFAVGPKPLPSVQRGKAAAQPSIGQRGSSSRKAHSTRRMRVSKTWPRGWESVHANCRGCSPARHLNATPSQVAKMARVQRAKRLLDLTGLPMTEVALQAGFRSLRRSTPFSRRYTGDLRRRSGESSRRRV